jgi:hypothetical protein
MPSKIIRRDGQGNIISAPIKRAQSPRQLLAAEIAAGRIIYALCLWSQTQAEEGLVAIDGRPYWALYDCDEPIAVSEKEARAILRGGS